MRSTPQSPTHRAVVITSAVVIIAIGALAFNAMTGCWPLGPAPAAPTPTCQSSAVILNCIGIGVNVTADGPFTFTFRGQTYSGLGNTHFDLVDLAAGPYEIAGRMSTRSVMFGFTPKNSTVPGGVMATSLQNLQGPLSVLTNAVPCSVGYVAEGSTPPPQDFRFQFVIGTGLPRC